MSPSRALSNRTTSLSAVGSSSRRSMPYARACSGARLSQLAALIAK